MRHVFTTWYFMWFLNVWTHELKKRVNACSIQGVVRHGKRSEDGWQKEGGLSRRSREELCWQCSTKPWQLHERPREKSCMKPWKLHEGSGKSRAALYIHMKQEEEDGEMGIFYNIKYDGTCLVPFILITYGTFKHKRMPWKVFI